jgi:Helix-turn-helix domain
VPSDQETPDPDPRALRALAHPLRWQLLDLLGSEGSATATRCSEVLGESVASCSYHLGMLAKYGYIEEVPGRTGREKPWRPASTRQDLGSAGLDTEGQLAAEAASEAFLDHEFARTRHRYRRRSLEPRPWRPAVLGASVWLTEEEYAAARQELSAVLERYRDRDLPDPSQRPAGSREARLFIAVSVTPAAPPVPAGPAAKDG